MHTHTLETRRPGHCNTVSEASWGPGAFKMLPVPEGRSLVIVAGATQQGITLLFKVVIMKPVWQLGKMFVV